MERRRGQHERECDHTHYTSVGLFWSACKTIMANPADRRGESRQSVDECDWGSRR